MPHKVKLALARWLMRPAQHRRGSVESGRSEINARVRHLQRFWFLLDAPLFIDQQLVERCYDAIFQPEFETSTRTRSRTDTKSEELTAAVEGSAEVSVPAFLKFSAKTSLNGKTGETSERGESRVETAIQSPERRLERLANLYLHSYPGRSYWVDTNLFTITDAAGNDLGWFGVEAALDEEGIRPLVVLDVRQGSRIIPMFGESKDGKAIPIYEQLIKRLEELKGKKEGTLVPEYPPYGSPGREVLAQRYWKALYDAFDSQVAIRVVEQATTNAGARIDWIDYRLIGFAAEAPVAIHLHVCPRANYAAGTLAYQFVRRGEKYGLRIVGMLKKGKDVNVLAIYER